MKFKLLLLSCVLISSQSFAQSSLFKQTNAAPVEDRIPTQVVEKKIDLENKEKIPENCIGHGGNWSNCIPVKVETSAVIPQSSLDSKALEPMSPIDSKKADSAVKIESKDVAQKVDVKVDSGEPLPLAAYPDNIKKYRDANGTWNFTNDESSIKPGTPVEKVDLNKLPKGEKGEKGVSQKVEKKIERVDAKKLSKDTKIDKKTPVVKKVVKQEKRVEGKNHKPVKKV